MKPTKAGTCVPGEHAKVVTKHKPHAGHHNAVFPQHAAGMGSYHGGPRSGHHGEHKATSKRGR